LVQNPRDSQNERVFTGPGFDPDQDEDVFENLDTAIIDVLAPDLRLASGVIAHLYKLPAYLRAFIYGFADFQGDYGPEPLNGFGGEGSPFPSEAASGEQKPRKRKRAAAVDDTLVENGGQTRKPRTKRYLKSVVRDL